MGSILGVNHSAVKGKLAMNSPEKAPRLVTWTGYLAITLLLLLPLAVVTVRSGQWQQGLLMYAIACFGSTVLMIVAIVLLMLPRFAAWRSVIARRALFAVPGTVLLLTLVSGGDVPRIHDITTDTADPPLFVTAGQQRGSDANPLDIDPEVIAQQQAAYPDLQTLNSTLSYEDAFSRALRVAKDLGWDIYHQDRNAGVIEAVDTTEVMAFKDDVVIRLRTNAQGTKLDLRSVSRVGEGDIGANAKRIRAFREAFLQQG
ncbi:MAG: DUF1499 domain-containing protein [Halioglobus sp.]